MPSREDVRRLALAQPEAFEADHHGMPSFRVGKKIFCTIHAPEHHRCMVKLDPDTQAALTEAGVVEPVPGYWGQKGSTFVYFETIEPERLETLIALAWREVAPKGLLRGA